MLPQSSDAEYSRTAKFLHWVMAALFLASYCVVYGKHWFTAEGTAAEATLLQLHQTIGYSIAIFVAWRICWRLRVGRPRPTPGSKWASASAELMHAVLYFFMIAMPVTGYLYAKNPTLNFGVLTIPPFGDTAVAQWVMATWDLTLKEGIREPMRAFHREIAGELVLWVLILMHAAAALYHHLVLRDDVLLRMLPKRFRN